MLALLFPAACSSGERAVQPAADGGGGNQLAADAAAGSGGAAGRAAVHTVPEGLEVTALEGGNGVLEMVALTLREGAGGSLEAYAALRNDGDVPACHAAVSMELFDKDEQSLAAAISGLLTQHFYRLTDGSGTIAACVGPGDVTMVALTDFPADLALNDVVYVVYRCPYFALDVVPIDGLTFRDARSVRAQDGAAYMGTLVNGLDVAVTDPSVSVFPVDRVGRPLGVAMSRGMLELPPGGSWDFETSPVAAAGDDFVAFPAGALAN